MTEQRKRRVYVMDCGNITKIGVSGNVELRKGQLPFKVYQYYATKPISNAFEIEKILRNKFDSCRAENINGNEYFNISFKRASDSLRELVDPEFAKLLNEERIKSALNILYEYASILDKEDIYYILGLVTAICVEKEKVNINNIKVPK